MSSAPAVSCVIVNWNGWRDTLDCLAALRRVDYPRFATVVVDNGSQDDSVARIKAEYPGICLVETGRNLGFSGGNNAGIREALGQGTDYVWLLNNDTEPAPDALREMVRLAESDVRLGAVGSLQYYPTAPPVLQTWGGGWINVWLGHCSLALAPPQDRGLDFITAASILVRSAAFRQSGLLDDRYFLYWEDVEFCFRLRRHGWKLGVAPGAAVLHKLGASSGKNVGARERYYTTSALLFLAGYAPIPSVSSTLFLGLRFMNRALRGRTASVREVCRGVRDYFAGAPRTAAPLA